MKPFALLLFVLLATSPAPAADTSAEKPPCCRRTEPVAKPTDGSLYQLESEWTSDAGRTIRLGVLQGRPLLVAMFFTTCEYACPILVHDLQRIQESLPAELRREVDILLVSFDTERDTPAVLRAFRESKGLGKDHWTLLTGRADDVRELAALLGVNYKKEARGQFAHSNVITLLNRDGEVAYQLAGLQQDSGALLVAVGKAVRAPAR
ncbi:MAG: SCO family protein [Limisphaerales bacterium]